MGSLTYQQRNKLAYGKGGPGQAPPPFVFPAFAPIFAKMEAETMGVYGTPKDGFDGMMAPLVAAIPEHAKQLVGLDNELKAATFTPGATAKAYYTPIGEAIAKLVPVGDKQLGNYNSGVKGSGGGGGGGSGGGGGGGQGGSGSTPGGPGGDPWGCPDVALTNPKAMYQPRPCDDVVARRDAQMAPPLQRIILRIALPNWPKWRGGKK